MGGAKGQDPLQEVRTMKNHWQAGARAAERHSCCQKCDLSSKEKEIFFSPFFLPNLSSTFYWPSPKTSWYWEMHSEEIWWGCKKDILKSTGSGWAWSQLTPKFSPTISPHSTCPRQITRGFYSPQYWYFWISMPYQQSVYVRVLELRDSFIHSLIHSFSEMIWLST